MSTLLTRRADPARWRDVGQAERIPTDAAPTDVATGYALTIVLLATPLAARGAAVPGRLCQPRRRLRPGAGQWGDAARQLRRVQYPTPTERRVRRRRRARLRVRQWLPPRAGGQLPAERAEWAVGHRLARQRDRHDPELRGDGKPAVRHGYRQAVAVPLPGRGRRLRLGPAERRAPRRGRRSFSSGNSAAASPTRRSPDCRSRCPACPGCRSPRNIATTAWSATRRSTAPPRPASPSLTLGTQHDHDFLLGVRYAFGVTPPPLPPPAPAPAAAPAPAPARSYLVFFDWDKATLTTRARQIIKEAADNSTKVRVHADRGERLHRHLGHAAVQPGPVDPPRARRWRPNW